MSSKKKQTKKHKFKYATPTVAEPLARTREAASSDVAAPKVAESIAARPVYSYVRVDMRKVGVMAGSLIIIEFLLWWLFGHTGLGNSVYNLVKV